MKVKVKLFATLRKDRFEGKEFEIDDGKDVDYLLNMFNLKREDVTIIFINGIHADYDTLLKESDDIAFFPPIGGG
ncbi:MAG TPA: MoaD/ThiS family protein [Spirochaetota bacterium]|nr:MoaD/ThiS family protein [Spirochaetota bacterium]HPS85599.1 MoaD/ThiS family protein [Spirochaetota bacterium]